MENSRSRDATASVSAVLNPTTRFALVLWTDRPVSGPRGRRPPFLKIRNRKSEIFEKSWQPSDPAPDRGLGFGGVVVDDAKVRPRVRPELTVVEMPIMCRSPITCRSLCLLIALGSLAAAPGCSSCFGSANSCRRPSFMEFRSPCGGGSPCAAPQPQPQPCQPACGAPMHEPACGPACGPCGEGGGMMSAPSSMPIVVEPGTFS